MQLFHWHAAKLIPLSTLLNSLLEFPTDKLHCRYNPHHRRANFVFTDTDYSNDYSNDSDSEL